MSANFFRIRNRRLLNLILILVAVGLFLLLFNLFFSEYLEGYWSKIFISVIPILIAVNELGDIFQVDSNRKKALYFLLTILFLVTIWDTTYETISDSVAADKRDSLITIDSLRAARIFEKLKNNLNSISETKDEIILLDSALGAVKTTLEGQVLTLDNSIDQSEKLVELNNQMITLQTGGNSYLKFGVDYNSSYNEIYIQIKLFGITH